METAMVESNSDIIQLNPDKSLHLRGNITVTPICPAQKTPIVILPKPEPFTSISSLLPIGSTITESSSFKLLTEDAMDNSLVLKKMFESNEIICFEGNKLNEETTIVAVKPEAFQLKKSKSSFGFTNISAMPAVTSIIIPSLQTKIENVVKSIKKTTKTHQDLRTSINNESKIPLQFKPIAPKYEEKAYKPLSQQLLKQAKSNSATKPSPVGPKEKLLITPNFPKNHYNIFNKAKYVQSTSQKVSQSQVKTKKVSGMTTISPMTGHLNKHKNVIRTIPKLQGTVKMSVTNGPLATLKPNCLDIDIQSKPTGNKAVVKKITNTGTSATQKSNGLKHKSDLVFKKILPQSQSNVLNKTLSPIVSPSLKPLVNSKPVDLKSLTNGLQNFLNKPVKVKGNHAKTAEMAASQNNVSLTDKPKQTAASQNNASLTDKPKQTAAPDKVILKSNDKPFKGNANGVTGNRVLLKKKCGRKSHSLNSSENTTLNTELSFTQKQNVAHEILAQLLIVTSQLPMVRFSHALETIELITDAYKFGHRVNMSIVRHEETNINDVEAFDVCYESDIDKSASTNLADMQVDGPMDVDQVNKLFQDDEATLSYTDVELVMESHPIHLHDPLVEEEPMDDIICRKRTSFAEFQTAGSKKLKTDP